MIGVQHQVVTDNYALYRGDCAEILQGIPDDSVHYEIYSPPFMNLYTFSDSERDLSNCRSRTEFFQQYQFIVKELYRVLMPGRLMSVHCINLPTSKARDGVIGLYDFRGDLIRLFQDSGFIYHSEVCIWKDPAVAMQRTKALGLLNKQKNKDSSLSRQALPDYLVTMRKPGENPERICHTNENFPLDTWEKYASPVWEEYPSPVWWDINPSHTLQGISAREEKDERHISLLQLPVIKRAINLWTNPGDTVLSPFGGIGSEPYQALTMGRKAIAIELKDSYYRQMVRNCQGAVANEQIVMW